MLSESFKGRGIRGKRRRGAAGGRDLTQTIAVRTDRGTHGSEVQHIVDLFVDYSPCATLSRSRERSIRALLFSRRENHAAAYDATDARCNASPNALRSRRIVHSSLINRE